MANPVPSAPLHRLFRTGAKPSPAGRSAPFTLTEAVAASVVAAMVLASGMGILSFYLWNDKMLDDRFAATTIAQNRITYLHTISYTNLALTTETNTRVDGNGAPSSDGRYYRTTTVTADATNPYSEVHVSVRIPARLNRPAQTIELATMVMDRDQVLNMK